MTRIKQLRALGQCAELQTPEKTRSRSEGELRYCRVKDDEVGENSRGFGARQFLIDRSPTHVTNAQTESLRSIRVHSVFALCERTSLLTLEK